ncbi:MAG: CDP-alcohol phosphatidyltransferase family protein [Patescibacteria group bacterium]
MKPLFFYTDRFFSLTVLRLLPRAIVPNYITVFRFLLVPVVFFLLIDNYYRVGGLLFIFAAFTDALDGALARTTNQITEWGKVFDPLADKLLVVSTAMILVTRFLNLYLALAIVGAELFLVLLAYWKKYYRRAKIEANYLGKTKMILQSVGLAVLCLGVVAHSPWLMIAANIILPVSVIFAIFSLFGYHSI